MSRACFGMVARAVRIAVKSELFFERIARAALWLANCFGTVASRSNGR